MQADWIPDQVGNDTPLSSCPPPMSSWGVPAESLPRRQAGAGATWACLPADRQAGIP